MFIKYDQEFNNKRRIHSTDFTQANILVSAANTIMKILHRTKTELYIMLQTRDICIILINICTLVRSH